MLALSFTAVIAALKMGFTDITEGKETLVKNEKEDNYVCGYF